MAALIDYAVIAVYATLLFGVASLLFAVFHWERNGSPFTGQLIGFLTLTLPVITYSCLSEQSRWAGTIGKKLAGIAVRADAQSSGMRILLRNLLKYLPWEMAHS